MGWGDEIIVTGQAREIHERTGRKVVVYDRNGNIRDHEIWRHNPIITGRAGRDGVPLHNGPGRRPYIRAKSEMRWTWREFRPPRGEIHFARNEVEFASIYAPQVVIEPCVKGRASPNKQWGLERWGELARLLAASGLEVFQIGPPGTQLVPNARLIITHDFRHACAVLAKASVAVLPEGGLHHAAAALGVKAVVLFGGYISPQQTGYDGQVSLFTGGEPCGMRTPCAHCAAAMAAISPEEVAARSEALLGG